MDDIRKSIVAILARETSAHTFAGTGFVCEGGLLITCAHVVRAARESNGAVRVRFSENSETLARVIVDSPVDEYDLAILHPDSLPAGIPLLRLAFSRNSKDDAFETYGFPELSLDIHMLAAQGRVLALLERENSAPVLQLYSEQVTKGYSGSPVWDRDLQVVVGVVNSGIVLKAGEAHHGTAFASPTETLRQIYPALNVLTLEPDTGGIFRPERLTDFDLCPDPGELPPGSRLYFHRNAVFTGRTDSLLQLARSLFSDSGNRTLAVTGIGGAGKTQLAVEFCYRYGRFFHGVHWINARDGYLDPEIAACGLEMGFPAFPDTTPEQVTFTLREWKKQLQRLIVLDNLEDAQVLADWLPRLAGFRILVTARRAQWNADLGVDLLPLDNLSRPDSLLLLRKLASRLKSSPDAELDQLSERLGDLPLALDLAGRFLNARPTLSVADYLRKIDEQGGALAHSSLSGWYKENLPTRHEASLASTFLLSWQQLEPDGVDFLAQGFFYLTGYCAPNIPIPREIFELFINEDLRDDMDDGLLRLQQLGLLTETLAIHPLLAEFARSRIEGNEWLESVAAIFVLYSNAMLETGIPKNFLPIRLHVEYLVLLAEKQSLPDAVILWSNLGSHHHSVAEFSLANHSWEHALTLNKEKNDLKQMPPILNNMGISSIVSGNPAKAEQYFREAITISVDVFGENHAETARCMNNLGALLLSLDRVEEARELSEKAYSIIRSLPERDASYETDILNSLSVLYLQQGDIPAAKSALDKALSLNQLVYGKESPQVANNLYNYGSIFLFQDEFERAQQYFLESLNIRQLVYPAGHPDVAASMYALGLLRYRFDDLVAAKKYVLNAIEIWGNFLAYEHPTLQTARVTLAAIQQKLDEQGKQ